MNDISYLTDRYGEKIEEINAFGAPLNFVFITDMHNRLSCAPIPGGGDRLYGLAADHIASIQYILDRCPGISCVVCGCKCGCGKSGGSQSRSECTGSCTGCTAECGSSRRSGASAISFCASSACSPITVVQKQWQPFGCPIFYFHKELKL